MKKKVGKVTETECKEIQSLFEHRNGLNELAKVLTANNSDLYERLVKDMSETSVKFQSWWDSMFQKYQWESVRDGHWEIDFHTSTIYLVTDED